ncbi:hypothetical protein ABT034_34565 [Streptomyces sp. NPDC002773]|uniref:hypothetical protein n=1 Tax=Streptomyces sp. NPDC002773 TaxID=3154430 RepID=UPI003325ED51
MNTIQSTGIDVSWARCRACSAVSGVILATDPLTPLLRAGGVHTQAKHGQSPMRLLEVLVEDAAVFGGHDPRPDPAGWVQAVNKALPADF